MQWVDQSTGLVYPQTYRVHILYQNSNWYIQDIQNVALLGADTVTNTAGE